MKKNWKRIATLLLALAMVFSLVACGNQSAGSANSASSAGSTTSADGDTSSQEASEPVDTSVNYKGNVSYVDIAEQLRADCTLDLDGLESEKFTITGYAQGYDFNEAWFGTLTQMVNSGCEVVLASGSSQFAFNFGGLGRTTDETDIRVGGVDSLTAEFADLLEGGVYDFCSGSHPSMIGPSLALVLRALEGNKLVNDEGVAVYVPMSHLEVHSKEEMDAILAADTSGNYAYNAGVLSALMTADYSTFMSMVSNADWEHVCETHDTYGETETYTLSENYKIGVLRNDTTSDEALAYEAYLTEMAQELGFNITFSESTEGNATNEINQIETWASAGYDAVICMSTGGFYDTTVACDEAGMYMVTFTTHPEEDDRVDMEALENYLGSVGPDKFNEAEIGYRMAKYYIDQGYTKFAVFGGSIAFGNEPHAYRVAGMIAAMIENETGVTNTDFNS